jgi:circadian clock protein KaiC
MIMLPGDSHLLGSAASRSDENGLAPEGGDPQAEMARTGIAGLDSRIGGLVRGRHYMLDGAPGAGKSSAALQFLGVGLSAGERCLVLTQDDPADLLSQAEYLGFDFRTAAESERLVVIRFRLDFPRSYSRAADPTRVFTELMDHVREHEPSRFVIDSMSPFLEAGRASNEALAGLPEFLDSLQCTSLLVVPGDLSETAYSRIYDRVIASSAGIFHFESVEGHVRQLAIRKLRQPVTSTEHLRFVIRPGVGIIEHEAVQHREELPAELRRRIIVLNGNAALSDELWVALERVHDVVSYESTEYAFAELVGGRYGALIIGIEPRDTERSFNLTRELRRAGNGAPILFVSPSEGLRGSTRARGLRAGGDDFLTDALSPEEFIERIEVARERGHRRILNDSELQPLVLQPIEVDGSFRILEEHRFRSILTEKLLRTTHPFFALVRIDAPGLEPPEAWAALCSSLRIKEGDLGALVERNTIVLYLHDVRRRHVDSLLRRISSVHPGLGDPSRMGVYCYPADRSEVEAWLGLEQVTAGAATG